ncbi:hypothetical protein V8E36_009508, partial [Tilletia maclaganii]
MSASTIIVSSSEPARPLIIPSPSPLLFHNVVLVLVNLHGLCTIPTLLALRSLRLRRGGSKRCPGTCLWIVRQEPLSPRPSLLTQKRTMPRSLAEVRAANLQAATALVKASPSFIPFAVLLGGTSGIGAATAHALSAAFRGKIHLVLSSRSESKAADVIRRLPFPPSAENGGSVEFVAVDTSL